MNGSVLIQSLKQLRGITVLEYKYHDDLPSIEGYHPQVKYVLFSSGERVVVNSGATERTSRSWEISAQRYVCDFAILDGADNSFQEEETEAGPLYCYGRDILVPADGTVTEICTRNPDSRITRDRVASCDAHDIRGNYVLICHSDGEHSLSAHPKPDSIRVSTG